MKVTNRKYFEEGHELGNGQIIEDTGWYIQAMGQWMYDEQSQTSMGKLFISIRHKNSDKFSVDISANEHLGGSCRVFRYLGDALIWIAETTEHPIPLSWPDLNEWDWSQDFHSWLYEKHLLVSDDRLSDKFFTDSITCLASASFVISYALIALCEKGGK